MKTYNQMKAEFKKAGLNVPEADPKLTASGRPRMNPSDRKKTVVVHTSWGYDEAPYTVAVKKEKQGAGSRTTFDVVHKDVKDREEAIRLAKAHSEKSGIEYSEYTNTRKR